MNRGGSHIKARYLTAAPRPFLAQNPGCITKMRLTIEQYQKQIKRWRRGGKRRLTHVPPVETYCDKATFNINLFPIKPY
jgi:hypothetical protein